jgi:hypothetical protein
MGERPDDFDEELVRKAPTFKKWEKLQNGETLSYACRQFTKGGDDDEERLMRRIMIARRNNLKEHKVLKKVRALDAVAQQQQQQGTSVNNQLLDESLPPPLQDQQATDEKMNPSGTKRRRIAGQIQPTDEEVLQEMDVPAVEATRSYQKWYSLEDGTPFTYNQQFVKGEPGHDWLLRKAIWRRMRYRRENRAKVIAVKRKENGEQLPEVDSESAYTVSQAVQNAASISGYLNNGGAFDDAGVDAEALAALGADDPLVNSALLADCGEFPSNQGEFDTAVTQSVDV